MKEEKRRRKEDTNTSDKRRKCQEEKKGKRIKVKYLLIKDKSKTIFLKKFYGIPIKSKLHNLLVFMIANF